MTTEEANALEVARLIAKLGDPDYRRECERRTAQHNKLSEHDAEQRHYSAQAQKVK
jgi:hypothetical protein